MDFTPKTGPNWLERNAGKIAALAAGAALAGSSGLSGADQVEFLSAYTADVLGDTGGTNMMGLTGQRQAAAGGSGGGSGGAPPPQEKNDSYTFSCPVGSASHTVEIPYYRTTCRDAAKDFARIYGCNLIDLFAQAGRDCTSACGNAQCLDSPSGAPSSSGGAFLDNILGDN